MCPLSWRVEMSDRSFDLPEELEEFRRLVREIVEEKIGYARAAEIDETDEFPWDVHKVFVDNELMAVGYPEEFGGGGGGSLTFAVMVEEISRVSAGCALIPLVSRLGATPGSPSARRSTRWGSGALRPARCISRTPRSQGTG